MPEPLPAPAPARRARRRSWINLSFETRFKDATNIPISYAENADLRDGLALGGVKQAHVDDLAALLPAVTDAVKAVTNARRAAAKASKAAQLALPAAELAMVEVSDRTTAAARLHPELRTAFRVGRHATKRLDRIAQLRRLHAAAVEHQALLEDEHGLTRDHLDAADAALDAAYTAALAADRRDVDAQDATDRRDEAMEPVDTAVRAIQTRSGPLGRLHPQLLELIGIRPR